jgi:hypothetical protein
MPATVVDASAVLSPKRWTNPRPGIELKTLDMLYGPDRRGIPALLALTAATAK